MCELCCAGRWSHVGVVSQTLCYLQPERLWRRPSSRSATPDNLLNITQSAIRYRRPTQPPSDILGTAHALMEEARLRGSWTSPAATMPLHNRKQHSF